MKFAKRIFAGLLIATLAVSCLALSSFAEAPAVNPDEIENVLEYFTSEDFMVEDFEDYATGDYVYAPICPECGERLDSEVKSGKVLNVYYYHNTETYVGDCTYRLATSADAASKKASYKDFAGAADFLRKKNIDIEKKVVNDGDNQVVEIINKQASEVRFSVTPNGAREKLVVSFRVKTDNFGFYDKDINKDFLAPEGDALEPEELVNGSNVVLWINDQNTMKRTFFSMNCNVQGDYKFTYLFYDESIEVESERFVSKTLELQPSLNEWYTVQLVIDCEKGAYKLDVTPDGEETATTGEMSIGNVTSYKDVFLEIVDGMYAGTKTWFDDISILEGTFVRNSANKEANTVNYILGLDALLKDSTTSVEDKIRIVEVYKQLFGDTCGYVTTDETAEKTSAEKRQAVDDIIANYMDTVTNTYVDALLEYAAQIPANTTYKSRTDFITGGITRFIEIFSDDLLDSDIAEIQLQFPGIDAEDVIKLKNAKAAYNQELVDIARVKTDSEAFLAYVLGYDDTNTDYNYMLTQLEGMKLFTHKDPTFSYDVEETDPYKTVQDAILVVDALEAKIEAIAAVADSFIGYVNTMAESDDFKVIYDNFVLAKVVYNDGVIHENLDNSTYNGIIEAIETYLEREIFVKEKAVESEAFINYVNRADKSTFYTAKLDELNKAALYIDSNKAELNAEKGYPGVAEAETLYNKIKLELETNVENARQYIDAVNAIASANTFATKKAAVEYASSLRADDKFTGIDGVKEANQKLYEADGEIKSLEGYSEMLIETVAALKASTDLEKRRAYIFAAKACIDYCEKTITGVNQAISDLETLTTQFNADVEALNAAFAAVMNGSGIVTSGANAN